MYVPVYVVDFVGVLALLPFFLVRFISEDFNSLASSCVVLTGLCNRVQLANLVLVGITQATNGKRITTLNMKCTRMQIREASQGPKDQGFTILTQCNES